MEKFNSDFEKRSNVPGPVDITKTTFCFVSSRIWRHKKSAVDITLESENSTSWKKIRIYDATNLAMWLDQNIVVAVWFSEIIGKCITGIQSLDEYWNMVSQSTTPNLTTTLFTNGRDDIEDQLDYIFLQRGKQVVVTAETALEGVLTFVSAVLEHQEKYPDFANKILIVSDVSILDRTEFNLSDMYLVLDGINYTQIPLRKRNATIIIPISQFDPLEHIREGSQKVSFERRSQYSFREGIESMGYDAEEAWSLATSVWMSFSALYRRLANNPSEQIPAWSEDKDVTTWIPALFVKAWDETYAGDCEVVGSIAGIDYNDYIKRIQRKISEPDAPVIRVEKHYGCVSIYEMWDILCRKISSEQLYSLLEIVETVFSKLELKYELPDEQHAFAEILNLYFQRFYPSSVTH